VTTPTSTYRLQLHAEFGFEDAAAVAPYLADLGITHAYLSPVLQAVPGSTHGYDVVDPTRPSDELGGAEGHDRLVVALRAAGLGQVLDIVPNHMAITGPENRWWWDVLTHGPSSLYAGHFDVTWNPPEEKLRNTVLLPILGDHYGKVLDRGEVTVERDGATFLVRYFDRVLPVDPRSLAGLLAAAAARAGDDDLDYVARAFRRLPLATRTDATAVAERHRDTQVLHRQLDRLLAERPATLAAVDAALADVNGDVDALDALLEQQNHRIAYWRTAERELGYRRFFDITTLVGLRVEDPEVFADTHELILRWAAEGVVDGLRVDHPDGLLDPEQYADRLARATGGVWTVVEKILETGEKLPASWPVAGTTGYDRLAVIGGLFVDPAGEAAITDGYGRLTGADTDVAAVVRAAREVAVTEVLAADVTRLTDLLVDVCEHRRQQRDRTRHELHEALRAVLVAFPVYRTYVRASVGAVRREDEATVVGTMARVAEERSHLDPDLLAFLSDLLLLRLPDRTRSEDEWVMRFQQLTGPAMAKGVEDTAFYRYTRLLALNEVGGDLARFGVSPEEAHGVNAGDHERWPTTMTTLSTHDTKRSADVRARLALLSEIPALWEQACRRWIASSARRWPTGEGAPDPDPHTQHLLFQTLVGAWPLTADRAARYLEKASREAKVRTSWTEPDAAFDEARDAWVAAVFDDERLLGDIAGFVAPLVRPGRVNALAQTLVQLTAPGVPDTYQGGELWDLSLVDPDNRRPVDFGLRRDLLPAVRALPAADLSAALADPHDPGRPKLRVVREALHLRRRLPEVFGAGDAGAYTPLAFSGAAAGHGFGFARGAVGGRDDRPAVAVVVPRLVLGLEAAGGWRDTTVALPSGRWSDVVSGATWDVAAGEVGAVAVRVADLLSAVPVALLERTP
jgi:(1->4)-alpha-D-glucan 1-alpha-D-glucosylmutase